MAGFDVFGMCNSIVDILVEADDAIIERLSLKKGIMRLVEIEESRKILEAVKENKKIVMPGGSGCNTMIGVSSMGGRVAFSNTVGRDEYGRIFEEKLKLLGVRSCLAKKDGMTGSSVILITPDSERTMNTCLGVCKLFSREDVAVKELRDSKILHMTAYLIDTAPEAGYFALNLAKDEGIRISFDVSDPFLVANNREKIRDILTRYVDIVFFNAEEAKLFTGKPLEQSLDEISRLCRTVVIKLGQEGSVVSHEGKRYQIPAFKANAVDTTGAGDMFAAGFLFGITNGRSVEEAANIGSFSSSKVVEVVGARLERRLRDEIEARFPR